MYLISNKFLSFSSFSNNFAELSLAFEQTEAYSELYMELLSDAKKAAAFITALMPEGMRGEQVDARVLTPMKTPEIESTQEEGDAHLADTTK